MKTPENSLIEVLKIRECYSNEHGCEIAEEISAQFDINLSTAREICAYFELPKHQRTEIVAKVLLSKLILPFCLF